MPAKSAKQERFMQAVAHNPAFAKKAGVPQSVGKEFMKKPKKFDAGGPAQMMGGSSAEPMQKSMAALTKMAGAGGTQGMGQGMQRPGGFGRMFGGKAAQMEKMRMAGGMPGGMGRFFGRQKAMQQAQQAAPGGMPSSRGLGGLFGRRMAMQAAPTEAPPGQDLSGFSGVTGGKAGGKVSNKSVGKNKDSKMKESKMMGGASAKPMQKSMALLTKMAKGGSVRGYGVSKVTNKTKYC